MMTHPPSDDTRFVRLPRRGGTLRGLSRGFLYSLISAGKVRSVKVPGPNGSGGIRIVDVASLDAYIEAAASHSQPVPRE